MCLGTLSHRIHPLHRTARREEVLRSSCPRIPFGGNRVSGHGSVANGGAGGARHFKNGHHHRGPCPRELLAFLPSSADHSLCPPETHLCTPCVALWKSFCGGLSSASMIESRLTPANSNRFLYSNFGLLFFLYYFVSLVSSSILLSLSFSACLGSPWLLMDFSSQWKVCSCPHGPSSAHLPPANITNHDGPVDRNEVSRRREDEDVVPRWEVLTELGGVEMFNRPDLSAHVMCSGRTRLWTRNSVIFTGVAAWLMRPGQNRGLKKPLSTVDLEKELTQLEAKMSEWLARHRVPASSNIPLLRWQMADIVTTIGACVMEEREVFLQEKPRTHHPSFAAVSSGDFPAAKKRKKIHSSPQCPICLDPISYYSVDIAVLVRCGHAFHFSW